MGCGASSGSKYVATQAQLDELTAQLRQQSEQIAQLVKSQHQLNTRCQGILEECTDGATHDRSRLAVVSDRLDAAQSSSRRFGSKKVEVLRVAAAIENSPAPDADPLEPAALSAVRVVPAIQNYAWGKPFEISLVAQLCSDQQLDTSRTFAEMWMGTHPNAPSSVRIEGPDGVGHSTLALKELIAQSPEFWLGRDAARKNLPYLLKVLSVNQALSIQAHPHKQLAEYLHGTFPDRYKDANHKPEICLPLGEFEALVAFRPFDEIRKHVTSIKELQKLLGDKLQVSLKDMYSRLMRSDADAVAQQVNSLVHRLGRRDEADLSAEEKLVLRLNKDYPGDVGIFSVFFLNYVRITADMSNRFIFCAPDEPHAYLYGDCVECMSLSDNVVRAGLTPKFKDVETLLDMMTYRDDRLDTLVSAGDRISSKVVKYDPPVDDFTVYEVEGGGASEPLDLVHASICICVNGSFSIDFNADSAQVEELSSGHSWFCRAGTQLTVLSSTAGSRLFVATY